ncbi:MAG: hypothetical protein OXI88_06975 [Gammaproteobacteria bacterium]|nr:hypothetical protein [Gammaproteobacteria bacterium]MDE0282926.1 hypothetical protein [Gammaproteobacteria bacterium]MDE0511506.1 hypothetical protein [Gammaproteobacteria bacterium]
MNYELVTVIITIIATQIGLAVLIWSLHKDISALKERMAHIEGLCEGFTGRTSP